MFRLEVDRCRSQFATNLPEQLRELSLTSIHARTEPPPRRRVRSRQEEGLRIGPAVRVVLGRAGGALPRPGSDRLDERCHRDLQPPLGWRPATGACAGPANQASRLTKARIRPSFLLHQPKADLWLVIGENHPPYGTSSRLCASCVTGSAFAIGSSNTTAVPLPASLDQIRPTWARTIAREIARPRPVPSVARDSRRV
jgi:hypothetical protein